MMGWMGGEEEEERGRMGEGNEGDAKVEEMDRVVSELDGVSDGECSFELAVEVADCRLVEGGGVGNERIGLSVMCKE